MEKGLEKKKKIKFITTVGDKESIIRELESRAEEPTISENIQQLKKDLEIFKKGFTDENYNNSDDFAKYMTNKYGKYLVVCMSTEHMYQMIRRTHELFDKVNPNIKVSYIGKGMVDSAKEDMFEKFELQESDNSNLNLLFLNKASTRYYNVHDIDGIILLSYARYHTKRNLAIVNEALKSCKDEGVVIQVVDSIDTLSKYQTLQECITAQDNYRVDFDWSDSSKLVEKIRKAIYSKKIDDNFKLELMREYKRETKKEITIGTVYKGYNIGIWKSNYRQSDSNGTLKLDDELRKKFEAEGILGDRLRRVRTTDAEKYDILIKYYKENPNKEVTVDTLDKNGTPIGEYRSWLQTRTNKEISELTQEQIDNLKEIGYLNLSSKEVKQLSRELKISEGAVTSIVKQYKSVKNFITSYKNGKINPKNIRLNKRGIVISKNELSMKQKQAYITLIEDIYGTNILEDRINFINEEDVLDAIDKLSDKRKQVIIERYGLDGNEPKKFKDIGEGYIKSRQHAKSLNETALKILGKNIPIYSISELRNSRDSKAEKFQKIKRMSYEEWKAEKANSNINVLELSEPVTEKLYDNGYRKMKDLFGIAEDELMQIKGLGIKKVTEVIRKTKKYDSDIIFSKKKQEVTDLKEQLESIESIIGYYEKANSYYMNYESIFDLNEIIPASVYEISEKTNLEKKKEEKSRRELTLKSLKEDIGKQNEKTEKLHDILELPKETKNKEEN